MKKYFLISFLFFIYSCDEPISTDQTPPPAQTIFINEFMASNSTIIKDNFGEYEDWVEIYNSGDATFSLKDHYLTDDILNTTKWKFPDVQLSGKSFLIIWCDGDTAQGSTHTSFKLSASGEDIAIFNSAGTVIDSIKFSPQKTDTSYGRFPDASANWKFMHQPTPGSSNK